MSLSSKRRSGKKPESNPPSSPSNVTILARKKRQLAEMAMKATEKVVLEKILGLTTVNNNGLTMCPVTGFIAYAAGCVVVLFNSKKNKFHYLLNTSRKPISSLAFSSDGKYLAVGDCGHNPTVRIWDITSSNEEHMVELSGHNYGISCTAFSPNLKYFVSVGYQHDMLVNVWNWKTSTAIASNKVSSKVYGLDFSEDSSYFVTVGNRHVKFWYFDSQVKDEKANLTHPLRGRSAILGDHRNKCFVAVSCGMGSLAAHTYCVTKSGFLCLFNKDRRLESFIECKIVPAHSIALSPQFVFCAGSEGTIRLFDPCSLEYRVTIPKPHPLGVNIATALDSSQFTGDGDKYADTIAIAVDAVNKRLTCIYNDHSLYVWDWSNIEQIGKVYSSLYHNACIWDIDFYPHLEEKNGSLLPPSCFATCSSDATVRFWSISKGATPVKNIYSKELSKILYTDTDTAMLKDASKLPGDARAVADSSRGIRSIRFSPDGQHMAVGDRAGNLKVHDLQFMDVLYEVEAHDAEILSIEYSDPSSSHYLMATSSRDRLIHVFKAGPEYSFLQTLDDHSASIPAIKFNISVNCLQLLSCGVDKSIMFRTLETKPELSFQRSNHVVSKATIYDMDIDASRKNMATVGQDRILRIYNIAQGKQIRYYKASESDEGSILKVTMDPSGMFVATSSSDKSLCLYDFYSGECLAKLYGHSEVVTGIKFSLDCKRLLSVSGDGCIFVWHLSPELTRVMHDRLMELGHRVPPSVTLNSPRRETYFITKKDRTSATTSLMSSFDNDEFDFSEPLLPAADRDEEWFRFSMSELPAWAQKRMVESRPSMAAHMVADQKDDTDQQVITAPSGAWAERVGDHVDTSVGDGQSECLSPDQVRAKEPPNSFVTKRGEITTLDDDLEVQNFSDSEEADAVDGEEVIYPSVKPELIRKDTELFKRTLPIKVESTDDNRIPEDSVSDDDDEVLPESPSVATPVNDVFISLDICPDQLFSASQPLEQTVDKRMSISTRFLSSSGDKQRSISTVVAAGSSASSSAGVGRKRTKRHGSENDVPTVSVSEPNLLVSDNHKHTKSSSKHKTTKQGNDNSNNSNGMGYNLRRSILSVSDTSLNKIPHKQAGVGKPPTPKSGSKEDVKVTSPDQTRKNPSFIADVNRTKKRLEELGLAVPTKLKPKNEQSPPKESDDRAHTSNTITEEQRHSDTPIPITRQRSVSKRSSKDGRQLPPLPLETPQESSKVPTAAVAATKGGNNKNSKPCESHLEMVENLIKDLDFNLKQLMDIHKESLAKCEQDENSDDDQIVAAVASAVSNIKAQSVNWYTKYRSRWKKCKARVAAREKANPNTRPPTVDSDATKKIPAHEKMAASTDTTTTTTSSSSLATVESIPSLPADNFITSEKPDAHTSPSHSSTGLTRDPEVLALLDKYSSELVAMVKHKLQ